MSHTHEALVAALINQTHAIGLTVKSVYLACGRTVWRRLACDARLVPLIDFSGWHVTVNGARIDVTGPENFLRLCAWPDQGATTIMEGEIG